MAAIFNVNGRITGQQDAVIPVMDHGFLYGEGVYEVARTYNHRPFLLDQHLQRMRRSAEMIALKVPFSDEELLGRIRETSAVFDTQPENREVADLYIRILLTRGVGEFTYDPASCKVPSLVIIVKPQVSPKPEAYERGVKVALVPTIRNHPASLNPLIKSNNLLNNALAAQEAIQRGGFEGVMRNFRGELSECSQSNLFIVKDGSVATPALGAGLLAGITRAFVFEVGQDIGVPVHDAVLHDDDLFGADECFITSTTKEIVPVTRVDDRSVGDGMPGPITKRLLERYRQKAHEMTKA